MTVLAGAVVVAAAAAARTSPAVQMPFLVLVLARPQAEEVALIAAAAAVKEAAGGAAPPPKSDDALPGGRLDATLRPCCAWLPVAPPFSTGLLPQVRRVDAGRRHGDPLPLPLAFGSSSRRRGRSHDLALARRCGEAASSLNALAAPTRVLETSAPPLCPTVAQGGKGKGDPKLVSPPFVRAGLGGWRSCCLGPRGACSSPRRSRRGPL